MRIEITKEDGKINNVQLSHFKALDGWEIQARFLRFAASEDKDFRREFTLEVLSYATVVLPSGQEYPLSTDGLIDNHLSTWKNIEKVFNAVLEFNGIDPSTHADRPHFWANAGKEMATAFLAEVTHVMAPALENMVFNKG